MPLPRLVDAIRGTAGRAEASLPPFELGTVITVRDGASVVSVEVAGGIVEAGKAGDEPFKAGDRVILTRRAPRDGGGAIVHGYA